MDTILITGSCGFIASNYIETIIDCNKVIGLDCLTYAASLDNCKKYETHKNYTFVKGSINNQELVDFLFKKYSINKVIHFAAESHVDHSINSSKIFFETNVVGTQTLLDVAKNHWEKNNYKNNLFINISTDEVYGSLPLSSTYEWTEDELLKPNSPYAASKVGQEMVGMSYYKTFGVPVITTRSSNNFGPHQDGTKLIPKVIDCLRNKNKIPIYSKGENVRDWLYVFDNCDAINVIVSKGKVGQVYNIGGNCLMDNITLVKTIIRAYQSVTSYNGTNLITFVEDRKAHDQKYCISTEKLQKLGWKPPSKNAFYEKLMKTLVSMVE